MSKQTINIGTNANSRDGDPLRNAFRKINENFDELYAGQNTDPSNTAADLIPDVDGTRSLGSEDKRWEDVYVKDFIYLNGNRIELTANGALLINGGPPAERQDTMGSVFADDSTVMVDGIAGKIVGPVDTTTVDATSVTANTLTGDLIGSVFADDSTLMVDGVTHTINLNGTVRDHIIPSENEQFDIGSPTNRFKDIYLKGSTIDLGGMKISNDGAGLQIATELEGGEAFAAGWWDTQWFKVGPFTGGAEIKVRIDDVPADPTNQAWIDFLRNIQPGDTFNIKTPVEQTLIVTSTVYEDHFTDTKFRFYFGVDVAPDIVGNDTYVYLVTADSIPANNLRIKYTPTSVDDWGFGSTPSNVAGALDLLADWITNRDISNITGSVFADDSTVLVDGVNGSINLDGTVKGNIIPETDVAYDIGSATNRFRDLYLSGSTINLGGLEITNDNGVITFGGNKVVVEGASGDVKGSVFADDSTLLVDGINSVVPKAVVEDSANWDAAHAWGDHAAAGYQSATAPFTGDVKGSVFGDDSTLLVDSVNSQIVGDYYGTLRNQTWMAAYDGFLTIANGGSTGPGPIQIVASANLDLSAGAGQVINANRNIVAAEGVTGDVTGNVTGNVTGDVNGSVFADDSTLLVDGANGTIPKANVEDSANWDTAYSWGDHSVAGYLTTFTETDPIVGAVNGIVKADGAGNISAAVAGTDYLVTETIDLATLKTEVAASADFADFQARIAAL